MSFQKGQKIVCIDDNFPAWKLEIQMGLIIVPKKDYIYTIRDINYFQLLLHEIINEKRRWQNGTIEEPSFKFHHFRPLQADEETIEEEQEHITNEMLLAVTPNEV